jgi:hypothetical protein
LPASCIWMFCAVVAAPEAAVTSSVNAIVLAVPAPTPTPTLILFCVLS